MTDEQRKAQIAALLRERRGYAIHGKDDRVAAVDAALRQLGASGTAPVERAAKRPAAKKGAKR